MGRFQEQPQPIPKPSIELVFEEFYPHVEIPDYGEWKKVCCPLHVESRPSASINFELNRWFCHACDISEDSLDVLMREGGLSFSEAKEWGDSGGSGVSQDVSGAVSRESSRGVPERPRFGRRGSDSSARLRRRFGEAGS